MKLEKAIEILTQELYLPHNAYTYDRVAAIKLGIEALRLTIYTRSIGQHIDPVLLPGETPPGDSP